MSADNMPPVVGYLKSSSKHPHMVRFSPTLVEGVWDIPLVTEAAAREYAAAQTRELVEALAELIEGAESMLGTCGVVRGDTPEDADEHTHDDWAEDFLAERTKAAIDLYGKHKGAA